jgi:hypothetical protein
MEMEMGMQSVLIVELGYIVAQLGFKMASRIKGLSRIQSNTRQECELEEKWNTSYAFSTSNKVDLHCEESGPAEATSYYHFGN